MKGAAAASSNSREEHCLTCSDEGVAMVILHANERAGLALCIDAEGVRRMVQTALLESPSSGDRVLVHAGTAIAKLQAAESPGETAAVETEA